MIRINLLGVKREKSKTRMPSVSMEGAKATALFVIIAAAAIAGLGVHYTLLQREKTTLEQEKVKAEQEKRRLQAVKDQVDAFEKKKALLTKKINIIEALKKAQTGPVTMLNALATTVESSGTIWLTSMVNDGKTINLDGIASNVNTVADFITNLKRSGQFKNVEIRESYEDESRGASTFLFSISAETALPDTPATAQPGAPAAKS